jgi:hypothetical protein
MKKQFYIATVVDIVLWGCELLTNLSCGPEKTQGFPSQGNVIATSHHKTHKQKPP